METFLVIIMAMIHLGFIRNPSTLIQGRTLMEYASGSIFAAGIVLFSSNRKMFRGAILQSSPAAAYLFLRLFT